MANNKPKLDKLNKYKELLTRITIHKNMNDTELPKKT